MSISVSISSCAVFLSLRLLPTSIISPFSFPTRSFSRHCTSLQNSKSASVFTTCVLISNPCPLLPQVPTTKTPSAYSVLHCPRRIPPNPGAGFYGFPETPFCLFRSRRFRTTRREEKEKKFPNRTFTPRSRLCRRRLLLSIIPRRPSSFLHR